MGLPRAILAHKKGDFQEASQHYQRALQQNSNNPAIYQNYGALLKKFGHEAEAHKIYQKGLQKFPNHPGILRNFANLNRDENPIFAVELYFKIASILIQNPAFDKDDLFKSVCDDLVEMLYNLNFSEKQWFEKISIDNLDESLVQNIDSSIFQIKYISDNKKFLSVKYLQKNVSNSDVEKLKKISKYIAYFTAKSSNLSNELIKGISSFENLVKLEIQDNKIDDESIKILQALDNLEILNVHNTKITSKSIEVLKKFKNLKRAYVWGTSISRSEVEEFNRKEEKLKLIGGS